MLRYGMANEESFQSLSEESTSDLSASRKRKGIAAVENPKTVKSSRWCDAEIGRLVELLEQRPCCGMYFARTIMSPLRLIQCLVFPLFVTLSPSSSNISSRARAAKHLFTVEQSRAIFQANQYGACLFSKDSG